MSTFINLIGAEDVQRAGNNIASAAESMRHSAATMIEAATMIRNAIEELKIFLAEIREPDPCD